MPLGASDSRLYSNTVNTESQVPAKGFRVLHSSIIPLGISLLARRMSMYTYQIGPIDTISLHRDYPFGPVSGNIEGIFTTRDRDSFNADLKIGKRIGR